MFGSAMLDIAVGVVFVFLLLSIFATAINEIILSFLNMRAKELLRGIQSLLNDDGPSGLVTKVYTHGQIYGLYQGTFSLSDRSNLPSYIPSRNFALALMGVVHDAGVANPLAPPVLPPASLAPPAPSVVAVNVPVAINNIVLISKEIRDGAVALAADPITDKLGKPLLAMITMAGEDANKLQRAVEDWYNSAMDRVSGWYKYRTQWVLFFIGLVMAASLNANTIKIVRQLSKDPTLRQSIVAAAQNAKAPTQAAPTDLSSQVSAASTSFKDITTLGIPLGWPNGLPAWQTLSFQTALETLLGWTHSRCRLPRSSFLVRRTQQDHGHPLHRQAGRKEQGRSLQELTLAFLSDPERDRRGKNARLAAACSHS
jgi:hypothetical protein